jgi:hypothetical protein
MIASSCRYRLATSQLALPQDACQAVYATDGYSASVRNLAQTSLATDNLAQTSLATDNVFRDGYASQLATVTGSVSAGYAATLSVPV